MTADQIKETDEISLKDLVEHCEAVDMDCANCEAVEFCNQYARYMSMRTPMVWNWVKQLTDKGIDPTPMVALGKSYFKIGERVYEGYRS